MKPWIIQETCVGCGICEENCPVHAIDIVDGKARINGKKCIRCYCCHELYPNRSVELRKNRLYALGKAIN